MAMNTNKFKVQSLVLCACSTFEQKTFITMATLISEPAEADVATLRIAVVREHVVQERGTSRRLLVAQQEERGYGNGHQPRPRRGGTERGRGHLSRRVCYCCLAIPFFLAISVTILSVVSFAVKNEEVKRKCSAIHCVLTCENDRRVYLTDCWIVFGGGAAACFIMTLFVLSLVVRMCFGTKM